MRRFVVKGLREQAYAVDTAATGEEALYQADISEYDLIIPDVMIPDARRFRRSGAARLLKAGRQNAPS